MSAKIRKRGDKFTTTVYVRGKRKWISGTTRQDVEEQIAEALLERRRGAQKSELIDSFAARWTRDYPRPKDSTNLLNAERVSKFGTDYAGKLLCDITRTEARAWALANRSRWKSVRAMFTDAVRDGLAPANPFVDMRLSTSRGRRDLSAPTETDVQQLADAACEVWGDYGRRVYSKLIVLAAYTGMRPGELYGLRWSDVDWEAGAVHVARQFNWKVGKMTPPKNGKERWVPLLPAARAALTAVPHQREEVFCTPRGGIFHGGIAHYYWHPVRCSVGRPDWDFYVLRHSFGTMLANRGLAPYDIAEAMGHQDGGKLAMDTYIHVRSRDARSRIHAAFAANVAPLEPRRQAVAE